MVVIAVVAAVLTVPAGIEFLASATNFLIFLTFIAVNVSVVVLRRAEPDTRRPFRVPIAVRGVPVLPLVGVATSIGLMFCSTRPPFSPAWRSRAAQRP